MAIRIEKIDGGFQATWVDVVGEVRWTNKRPMDRESLTKALTNAGCHPIDIYDQFERIDPTSTLSKELPEDVAEFFQNQAKKLTDKNQK